MSAFPLQAHLSLHDIVAIVVRPLETRDGVPSDPQPYVVRDISFFGADGSRIDITCYGHGDISVGPTAPEAPPTERETP